MLPLTFRNSSSARPCVRDLRCDLVEVLLHQCRVLLYPHVDGLVANLNSKQRSDLAVFLRDSPEKYSCIAVVMACGLCFIRSNPKFTVNHFPQSLQKNF